jgi:ribosomal protein S18 acetylase RimI-like enzyme
MPKEDISIRAMRAADADVVLEMMRGLAAFHGDASSPNKETLLAFALGRAKLAHVLIAFHRGAPAGFVLTYDQANFILGFRKRHIDLIYVEEAFRREGIGAALVKAVARGALAAGCRRITVNAVATNDLANRFYTKLGFQNRPACSTQFLISGDDIQSLAGLN